MTCDRCGAAIALVSGRRGGYYGCLGATKKACDNRVLVRRQLIERLILSSVRDQLCSAENVAYVLARVEKEVSELTRGLPETIRLKQAEMESESRRIQNLVEFIAEGRGSRALAEALGAAERRVDDLRAELDMLRRSNQEVFRAPPLAWIEERVARFQEVLEQKTERSALLLRKLLGSVSLVPVEDVGEPEDVSRPQMPGRGHYRAKASLQVLALLEPPPEQGGADRGANSSRWWSPSTEYGSPARSDLLSPPPVSGTGAVDP